jgi:hypothetical protein
VVTDPRSPERDPDMFTEFPCACGDPLTPGLHKTRGGACEPAPPGSPW